MRHTILSWGAAAAFAAAVAAPAPAQEQGGSFIMAMSGEPQTLVGFLATDTNASMIANNVFSKLVALNPDMTPRPDLAQSWEISDDGLTYTFDLVENATFHDGEPVTAEDVVFSVEEIIANHFPRASSWIPNVEHVRANGPHQVEFKLREPFAPFMTLLGTSLGSGLLVYPKHIYEGTDIANNEANFAPVGSGPFEFSEWRRGSFIELVRNDDYFKDGLPYLDRVIGTIVPDASSRLVAFEQGEIDFLHMYILPNDQIGRLKDDPRFEIAYGGNGPATSEFLLFNLREGPLADKQVRQAIAHALDLDDIRDKSLFGEGKVATSHINSALEWVQTDEYAYSHDVEKANQMLDEAGFPRGDDGMRFSIRGVWSSGRDFESRAAEVIRSQLRELGIDYQIETYDRPTFIDKVFRNWDFDAAHQLFTTGPDPTMSVPSRYHTNQIVKAPFVNGMGYSNSDLDAIFDREFAITDQQQRVEAWHEAQRILMEDLPALPLFEMPAENLVNARFRDAVTTPFGYVESRERTYLVE